MGDLPPRLRQYGSSHSPQTYLHGHPLQGQKTDAEPICAVSLQCSNDICNAIRVLEVSRGAINRLTISSKADLSLLYRLYPDLAKRYEDLRFLVNLPPGSRAHETNATPLRQAVVLDLEELILEIRTRKGFEHFHNLPSKSMLVETVPDQSTVLLNTTKYRTDTLLIHSHAHIQALPLSQLIYEYSRKYYCQIRDRFGYDHDNHANTWLPVNAEIRSFLEWLWDNIVGPVLHGLNLRPLKTLSEYNLPDNLKDAARLNGKRQRDTLQDSNTIELSIIADMMEQHPNVVSSSHATTTSKLQSRSQAAAGTNFPRLHWIGVGHMAAFPFHAAGYGASAPKK